MQKLKSTRYYSFFEAEMMALKGVVAIEVMADKLVFRRRLSFQVYSVKTFIKFKIKIKLNVYIQLYKNGT